MTLNSIPFIHQKATLFYRKPRLHILSAGQRRYFRGEIGASYHHHRRYGGACCRGSPVSSAAIAVQLDKPAMNGFAKNLIYVDAADEEKKLVYVRIYV